MPTGYTADIKDGITFKTYAMNCARAFGACVLLRDEPGGGEKIPDAFEPSSYHADRAAEAKSELSRIGEMSPAQRDRAAAKAWDEAETYRFERLAAMRAQQQSYEAMLAQVNAWTPPTPEHVGLHEFMREQITKSIDWDCDAPHLLVPAKRQTGEQWAAERVVALARDIEYHERKHEKEVERAASRTAWVQALRTSLG